MGALHLQVHNLGVVIGLMEDHLWICGEYPVQSRCFATSGTTDKRQAESCGFGVMKAKGAQVALHDPFITVLHMAVQRTVTQISSDISLVDHKRDFLAQLHMLRKWMKKVIQQGCYQVSSVLAEGKDVAVVKADLSL